MKLLIILLTLAQCIRAKAEPAATVKTDSAPVSGVIHSVYSTTWFDRINMRSETRSLNGEIQKIFVTGEHTWAAFPRCGRVVKYPASRWPTLSYPEQMRHFFSRTSGTNFTLLSEEVFRGMHCLVYQEVEQRPPGGGIMAEMLTNRYAFLANSNLPVILRQGWFSGWNSNSEVLSVQFGVPIPGDLFTCPTNLKLTHLFRVPAVPFEIELRQSRCSPRWGWTNVSTNLICSDGRFVTNRCMGIHQDAAGTVQEGPRMRIEPFARGVLALDCPMSAPYWGAVRKVGEHIALGMQAEVLEYAEGGKRYWVVDHPILGAFSAKWTMLGDVLETNEVIRVEIRE